MWDGSGQVRKSWLIELTTPPFCLATGSVCRGIGMNGSLGGTDEGTPLRETNAIIAARRCVVANGGVEMTLAAVTVSKATNELRLTDNGKLFKRYHVGTGEYSKTPVGDFKIIIRLVNPPWWRADGRTIPFGDPENILGTHWLGLNVTGYGIHGTWDTNSIGKQATAGCIRLLNDDVAELYTILPVGSPVGIHD